MSGRPLAAMVIWSALVAALVTGTGMVAVNAQEPVERWTPSTIGDRSEAAPEVWENSTGLGLAAPNTVTQAHTVYLPSVQAPVECSNRPVLITPANDSTLDTLWPTYGWNYRNNPGATEKRFEVALDPAFTQRQFWWGSTGIHGTTDTQEYARPFYNLTAATVYYLRAYIRCGPGLALYSDVWSFTAGSGGAVLPAAAPLEPWNGSHVPATTVTLRWSPLSGADHGYLVYYHSVGGYESTSHVDDPTFVVGPLAAATTYEWWIQGANNYALGASSVKWQFTTP